MEAIDYLSDAFVTEAAELDKVRSIAAEARETLTNLGEEGAWTYELIDGKASQPAKTGNRWSHSTSAMILFATGVASGRILSSTLAPFIGALPDKTAKHRNAFDQQLRLFIRNVDAEAGSAEWHTTSDTYGADDPFTRLWVLETFGKLSPDTPEDLREAATAKYEMLVTAAKERVTAVFGNPEHWKSALALDEKTRREALEHSFPVLRVVQLYHHLPAAAWGETPPSFGALLQYLQNRLHLHLSYFAIPDASYDSAELAFTMEAMLLLDRDSIDAATVTRCRQVLLDTQKTTSYWRPLRPFIATPQGMGLLPLSVETGNSLIRSCETLARRDRSQADRSRDIALFQRYSEWLFGRIVRGKAQVKGRPMPFVGWRSEHADDRGKIHLWETSQVLVYLLQYESFLQRYRAAKALRCMHFKVTEVPADAAGRHDETHADTPLGRWTTDSNNATAADPDDADAPVDREPLAKPPQFAVFAKIGDDFMKPRTGKSAGSNASYSMLLYGPQGTGKTELATNVARALRWPLITISPSDFMVSGDTLVEARAKQVFDVLEAQADAVILLDEVDRLILDRNTERYEKQSDAFQLMTPGMLTKFQNLRDAKRSIFIVSTNYAERIDPAIKREGRIDQRYLVLPPDKQQRARILRRELRAAKLAEDRIPAKGDVANGVPKAALFGFGELKKLAQKTAAAFRDGTETRSVLEVLDAFAGDLTPTIRLAAYRSRFAEDRNSPDVQQPFDEFLMLIHLIAEAREPRPEEITVWKDVLGPTRAERLAAIDDHVTNQAVRDVLYEADQKFASAD